MTRPKRKSKKWITLPQRRSTRATTKGQKGGALEESNDRDEEFAPEGSPTHVNERETLQDGRLPLVERQALAAEIAQTRGNQYLKRVVADPAQMSQAKFVIQPKPEQRTVVNFGENEGTTIVGEHGNGEGEAISSTPTEDQDIDNYISAVHKHLGVLINRHQTAFSNFGRQVQDKDLGPSKANILGAALKKGIEIGTKKLVETIGKRVPGLSEAADVVGTMKDEVDRAKDAAAEDKMDNFINGVASDVVMKLTEQQLAVENNKMEIRAAIKTSLAEVGGPDSNERIVWLVDNVVHPYQALLAQVPSVEDIELGMVQEWLANISGREYHALGGWRTKGHLFFQYRVDEEKETARLVDMALAGGEYANVLLEVLQQDVFKDQSSVSMANLGLSSVVRVQSEQNYMKHDSFSLGPGRIKGSDDGYHLFTRFIKHLPEKIELNKLEAKSDVYL